jgi:hypothetical protein
LECPPATKLVTFEVGGETGVGVLTYDGVVDSGFATMSELLARTAVVIDSPTLGRLGAALR